MQKPIYVICGKDDSLVWAHCDKLLDELLPPEHRATGLFKPDDADVSASQVLDELRTAPLLSDKRAVLLKDADDFISKNRSLLEKYFDNPCSTGRLILTVKTWDTRTKLAKKLTKTGTLINITTPKRYQLPQYLVKYAEEAHGKKIGKEAAELLIDLTGDELTRLYSEIDKLALFSDTPEQVGGKVITVKHVEALIGHNRIFGAFEVIDAIINGDTGRAVARLRNMFAEDRDAQYTVVGAFAFHFRRMFKAKVMLGKGIYIGDIVKRLQIWSSTDRFFAQLRKISLEHIGSVLKKLAEIDYAIKTGRAHAEIAMEQLVLNLLSG